jgi:hypothetical protein
MLWAGFGADAEAVEGQTAKIVASSSADIQDAIPCIPVMVAVD